MNGLEMNERIQDRRTQTIVLYIVLYARKEVNTIFLIAFTTNPI